MSDAPATASPHHDERLWPGASGWGLVVGFTLLMTISVLPVHPVAAGVTGTGALLAGIGVAIRTSPRVRVADGRLHAGAAVIDARWLGEGAALDRDGVRAALGPGSDARTYAVLRSWLPGAVLLPITDPQDPTPAWLISSRRPAQLLAAVEAARAAVRGPDQPAHSEQIG